MNKPHLFLNPTEELEHGDVGRRFGHAQSHTDALQLYENTTLLHLLLGMVHQGHPGRLELRDQEAWKNYTSMKKHGCHQLRFHPKWRI